MARRQKQKARIKRAAYLIVGNRVPGRHNLKSTVEGNESGRVITY